MNEKIHLSAPHLSGEEKKLITEALDSNWVAPLGPFVEEFEKSIAGRVERERAVATSSGTAAIHLALRLLGIQPGDFIFCSSLTFVASANPVMYEKGVPVFIDSEADTWNMCPKALEKGLMEFDKKGTLPKAVIVVQLYGQSAKMNEIVKICEKYNVPIIEDAAEALGTTYQGRPCGSFGIYSILSFNGNKIITTSGGGTLLMNSSKDAQMAKHYATQARDEAIHYQHSNLGYNYRMSNISAAIGVAQLKVLDDRINGKREIFERYKKALESIEGISFMPELTDTFSTRWISCMLIDPKKTSVRPSHIYELLISKNIDSRPIWKPLHMQPLFVGCHFVSATESSYSEYLFENGICLPSHTLMTREQQERIIEMIKSIF